MALKPQPTFIVIGASKSGSTTLASFFGDHPEVVFSDPKEPSYFSHHFTKDGRSYDDFKIKDWNWYQNLFREAVDNPDITAVGEASVSYTDHCGFPGTAKRIAETLPDIKIIYIVRHPIARLPSFYVQWRENGFTNLPFNKAIREIGPLIDTSCFYKQLSFYRKYFPDDRILVLPMDELKNNPTDVRKRLFSFIGVDPEFKPRAEGVAVNARVGKKEDVPAVAALRDSVVGKIVRKVFSAEMRVKLRSAIVNRYFRREIDVDTTWQPDTLAWAIATVQNDAQQILRYMNLPEDYWDLYNTKEIKAMCESLNITVDDIKAQTPDTH